MMKTPIQPPPIRPIRDVVLPDYTVREYPNGLRLIIVSAGNQEVFKLETIFQAGRFYEKDKMIAGATLRLLREGAVGYDSEKIAETIDFYGATLSVPTSLDYSGITLYGLNQHFEALMPLYKAVVTQPTFPESELQDYILERKQQLQIDASKNDVVAYRYITEAIFGNTHPYGYNSSLELYDTLKVEQLKDHFDENYRAGNCTVVISGRINEEMITLLEEQLFVAIPYGKTKKQNFLIDPNPEKHHFLERKDALQTAIRVGMQLFDPYHPDYFGFYFLNVILGDYFSSRLMMNIREDKGYTYNIYSMMDIMKEDGMFLIATEIANEHAQNTLKEIEHEFMRLKEEFIPDKELEMARNFTLGSLLAVLDGPMNAASLIKRIEMSNLGKEYFPHFVDTIRNITKEELKTLAKKYLHMEKMYVVLVGKK